MESNSNAFLNEKGELIIENARLIYKNFSGLESGFNRAGDRNFCVFIDDPDVVAQLQEEGWNVKIRKPREEGDPVANYIKVNVSYRYKKPTIVRHIGTADIYADEDTVGELDKDDILSADLVISPSHWEKNGKSGISGYVKNLDATVAQDYFASKYNR